MPIRAILAASAALLLATGNADAATYLQTSVTASFTAPTYLGPNGGLAPYTYVDTQTAIIDLATGRVYDGSTSDPFLFTGNGNNHAELISLIGPSASGYDLAIDLTALSGSYQSVPVSNPTFQYTLNYGSRYAQSYTGQVTSFTARLTTATPTGAGFTDNMLLVSVPELGTWCMMIAGMAMIGVGLRCRTRVQVSYAG